MSSIKNEDNTLDEYEESFRIEVTTGKGSSIKVEHLLIVNLGIY